MGMGMEMEVSRVEKGGELMDYVIRRDGIIGCILTGA